jgi:5-methylcytosine-specific restriction endonuclease McrA
MPRDNEPWVKVKIGARRSGKIAALPGDSARLGYFYLLLEAKVQRRMGVFDGRPHFAEVMGRFGRFLPDYICAGLVHEAPALCPACSDRFEVADGCVVVHDFLREQRSGRSSDQDDLEAGAETVTGAQRTKLWRLRRAVFERDNWTCRYCGRGDYERDWLVAEHVVPSGPTTLDNLVTACRGCNKRKGPRTPADAGMVLLPLGGDGPVTGHRDASQVPGDESQADVTRRVTSRAPESTGTVTVTERIPKPSSRRGARPVEDEGPLLTKPQLDAWASFGPEWDAFKAAWLDRGLRLPPSGDPDEDGSQRSVLHPIVADWPGEVASWTASAPRGASGRDVVGHVIRCYRDATGGALDEVPD